MQTNTDLNDGREDFDFLVGRWTVRHRRLKARLADCDEWVEFGGTCELSKTVAGLGNVDDNWLDLPGDAYAAMTLRKFDPVPKRWSIWWFDARYPNLEPAVHGTFEDGVGAFFGDDLFEGRPIRVRFLWSDTTATSCQWRQAFSEDAGATWETNWEMWFSRAG